MRDQRRDPPCVLGQTGFLHGGDWNPDQWFERPEVLAEDLRLMPLAGCNTVSLAVFSWTALQPGPGRFTLPPWSGRVLRRKARV